MLGKAILTIELSMVDMKTPVATSANMCHFLVGEAAIFACLCCADVVKPGRRRIVELVLWRLLVNKPCAIIFRTEARCTINLSTRKYNLAINKKISGWEA